MNDYSYTCDTWYRREHEHAYMVCNILSIDFRFGFARNVFQTVVYPGILFGGGVQQIPLWAEDRENGDLGAVAS